MDAERMPVLVGVGQINDRPDDAADGLDSLGLMQGALAAADADAGGGWLTAIDSLAVIDQISFPALNPAADRLARAVGASPCHSCTSNGPNGDSPIRLLNEAANRIAAGDSRIAAVAGGEALRTAARRRARQSGTDEAAQNALRVMASSRAPGYRQRHGLATPVDIYPLYENACRAAWGQSLAAAQAETAAIWSRLSEVAATSAGAWLRTPLSAETIVTPSADNRPIAFPYTKLMVANASVNQGAAFLVTSLAEARRRGVATDRLIHIGRGAAAHEPEDILARSTYDQSPSMAAVLRQTLARNAVTVDDLDLVELYSCFPCVPKMARRVIGWPVDRAASVFGGLTFGGGPIGNYMSHAVAAMVDRLRAGEGARGLLFANGGFATHNHAIVVGRDPVPGADQVHPFDIQAEADATRSPVPALDKRYAGPATIETYTVFYRRDGTPRSGVVIARTAQASRTLATIDTDDAAIVSLLTDGSKEPVGMRGTITNTDGTGRWQF